MSIPGLRPERAGRRAGWMLAGTALFLAGLITEPVTRARRFAVRSGRI